MLIVFSLSDADSFVEVVVGNCRIQGFVTVLFEKGRLTATGYASLAVVKEEFFWDFLPILWLSRSIRATNRSSGRGRGADLFRHEIGRHAVCHESSTTGFPNGKVMIGRPE